MPADKVSTLQDLRKRIDEINGQWDAIDLAWQKAKEEIIVLENSLLPHDVAANWKEQEADEVGFELYLRAQFHPLHFTWIWERSSHESLAACRAQFGSSQVLADRGSSFRGEQGHPSPCWRVFDKEVLERARHEREYEPLLAKAEQVDVIPKALSHLPIRTAGPPPD